MCAWVQRATICSGWWCTLIERRCVWRWWLDTAFNGPYFPRSVFRRGDSGPYYLSCTFVPERTCKKCKLLQLYWLANTKMAWHASVFSKYLGSFLKSSRSMFTMSENEWRKHSRFPAEHRRPQTPCWAPLCPCVPHFLVSLTCWASLCPLIDWKV